MAWRKSPPALIELFDAALPEDPRVERRQMFGYPAAFAGGNMFAGLFEDKCVLRLAEAEREALRSKHGAVGFEPMPGRPMREYSVLPEKLLADRKAFRSWLERGLAYAASLPPKSKKRGGPKPKKPGKRA